MAVIFSFLSDFRNVKEACDYLVTKDGSTVPGKYTNDAPILYLIRKIREEKSDEKIKIMFILSEKVYTTKCFDDNFEEVIGEDIGGTREKIYPGATKTLFEFYQDVLTSGEHLGEKIPENITIDFIPYDMKEVNGEFVKINDSREVANQVYLQAVEKFKKEDKVYIDYTGGLRDMNYLMVLIIDYFKLAGIECKTIVYSSMDRKITEINYIHNISKIIHAVDDFTETGSVDSLKRIIEEAFAERESQDAAGTGKRKIIRNIVESLDSFVKEISIGNADSLDKIREAIASWLNQAEEDETQSADMYSNIFMMLIPKIRESLYMDENDKELGYPEIVRWCVEHRFLQQAATVYVEKMPTVYLSAGLSALAPCLPSATNTTATDDSIKFYKVFWDRLANCRTPRSYVPYKHRDCKSYSTKMRAIDYLEKFQLSYGGCEDLLKVLRYYLAVKIIRNHMNHAAEMQGDDFKTYNLLFDKNETAFTYDIAKECILEGVEITQRVRDEKIQLATKEVSEAVEKVSLNIFKRR